MPSHLPLAAIPGLFKHYTKVTTAESKRVETMTPTEVVLDYLDEKQISKTMSKVYLFKAGTGTGKSTYFVSALWRHIKESVLITQPKVNLCKDAMVNIPMFEKDIRQGIELGYTVGYNSQSTSQIQPKNKLHHILFMTTEKLQQRLLKQINTNTIDTTYKYILIDEAHEIDEQMIFTLAVMRRYLKLFSKDLKCPLFIIMSATFDLPHFIEYFDLKPDYRDVGTVVQTPESLAMKYKIERNWITCRPETTILYPDKPPLQGDGKEVKSSEKEVKDNEKEVKDNEKEVKDSEKEVKSSEKEVKSSEKEVKDNEKEVKSSEKEVKDNEKEVKSSEKEVKSDKPSDEKEVKDNEKEVKSSEKEVKDNEKEVKSDKPSDEKEVKDDKPGDEKKSGGWGKPVRQSNDSDSLSKRFIAALDMLYEHYEKNKIAERAYNSEPGVIPIKDVLIFCSGGKQIDFMLDVFNKHKPKFDAIGFGYAGIDFNMQNEAYTLYKDNFCKQVKFIFSTNLLQAGVTIQSLYTVIDLGVYMCMYRTPLTGTKPITVPISKSSEEQRVGRVGRKGDGISIQLYRFDYPFNPVDPSPLVLACNVMNLVQRILKMDMKDYDYYSLIRYPPRLYIQGVNLLQNISIDLVNKSIFQLKTLGVIDEDSYLTPFGVYVMYNNISMVEMVTVLCGGNLYQTSIIHGIFDNKPKESEVGSLIRRMLGSDKSITGGGFQIIDNTMPILISAKNYYYDNINVLKYDHNAKLDIDRLINIIETAGLVV